MASSSTTEATNQQIGLKLLVGTKAHRVVFAEAGKDFVDFLVNLSHLPVGIVTKLLANQGVEGCLANIYKSIEDYGHSIMHPSRDKDDLFNTTDPQELLDIQTTSSYAFSKSFIYRLMLQAMRIASLRMSLVEPSKKSLSDDGGYVRSELTYMVMDDLSMRPNSAVFDITMLKQHDVKNIVTVETREVYLRMNEASLYSKTLLTDVFIGSLDERINYWGAGDACVICLCY